MSTEGRKRIAVLMAGLEKEYQRDYADGLRQAADEHHADLFFFVCQGFPETARVVDVHSESRVLFLPRLNDFDGVITLSRTFPDRQAVIALEEQLRQNRQVRQVFLDVPGDYGTRIGFDDNVSLKSLMAHMLENHGCRRFALVTGPVGNTVADARAAVCRDYITEHGGEVVLTADGSWTETGGRQAALRVLELSRLPDAVICGNDDMALALIDCLAEHGVRVPQDVLVTGFDATRDAVERGLTTIRRSVRQAGMLSVERLLGQENIDGNVLLTTRVLPGTSCGCEACRPQYSREKDAAEQRFVQQSLLRGVGFTSEMCGTSSLQEAGEVFLKFGRLWGAEDFHIVVDPRFFCAADSGRDGQLPEQLLLLAGRHKAHSQTCISFEGRCLLPDLAEREEASALAFLPLYYRDRSIGYVAVDLKRASSIAMLPVQTLIDCALTELAQRMAIRGYIDTL